MTTLFFFIYACMEYNKNQSYDFILWQKMSLPFLVESHRKQF